MLLCSSALSKQSQAISAYLSLNKDKIQSTRTNTKISFQQQHSLHLNTYNTAIAALKEEFSTRSGLVSTIICKVLACPAPIRKLAEAINWNKDTLSEM